MFKGRTFIIIGISTIFMSACFGASPNTLAATSLSIGQEILVQGEPAQNPESDDIQSLDGRGNNLSNPNWGSVNELFLRFSEVAYADGISSPAGANRPSARLISNTFSASPEEGLLSDRDLTALVYAWGQFVDHDIALTRFTSSSELFSIVVPTGDIWFDPSGTGTATIPVLRSVYDPSTGTSPGNPRQQYNAVTAFIDGSQIYGSDAERAAALREFNGGLMKTSTGDLLPFNVDGLDNDNDAQLFPETELFLAGDVRANENPDLLSLQILFVREHNRIASEAALENPTWADEELYQYARHMVIAELQKITYEEFLPSLLGTDAIPSYQGYREDVNPGIATEFSTAAYRLGHSMLGDDVEFLDNDGNDIREALELRDSFFNPTVVSEVGIAPILKYLASDNSQEIDTMAVDDLRNFLFGEPGQGGFDLASLNIQRGRDHGLADYNTVRAAYGLERVSDFDQITSDPALQAKLEATYGNIDNIDLWIGGLAEDHLPNSSIGITFSRILVDQFTRLRDGDRFWYQASLSDELVQEIQNTTLADIIRNNTELTNLQEDVFFFDEEEEDDVEISEAPPEAEPQDNLEAEAIAPNRGRQNPHGGRGPHHPGSRPPRND